MAHTELDIGTQWAGVEKVLAFLTRLRLANFLLAIIVFMVGAVSSGSFRCRFVGVGCSGFANVHFTAHQANALALHLAREVVDVNKLIDDVYALANGRRISQVREHQLETSNFAAYIAFGMGRIENRDKLAAAARVISGSVQEFHDSLLPLNDHGLSSLHLFVMEVFLCHTRRPSSS
jgi:hypothetical protein